MRAELTLRDTLHQLAAEGFPLPDDYESVITNLEVGKTGAASPWYVRLFAGLSAWISAILFTAFLFIAGVLQSEESGAVVGLIFCAIAVGLVRLGPQNDFLRQLGLALSLAGQILFLIGLNSLSNFEILPTALGLIALEIVLLWAYDDLLHRVISTMVIPGAILATLFDLEIMDALHILVLALGAGVFALQARESRLLIAGLENLIKPLSYGMAISLLGLLIMPLLEDFEVQWWITAVLLGGVLLFLISQIATDLRLDLRSGVVPWLLGGCLVLLIPAIRMPGILGALIVLLLGFWRNNRLMIGLAAVFLVFFLGAYYYSLEWTLLVKSLALMGTGAIMFLLRYILFRFAGGGAP